MRKKIAENSRMLDLARKIEVVQTGLYNEASMMFGSRVLAKERIWLIGFIIAV